MSGQVKTQLVMQMAADRKRLFFREHLNLINKVWDGKRGKVASITISSLDSQSTVMAFVSINAKRFRDTDLEVLQ